MSFLRGGIMKTVDFLCDVAVVAVFVAAIAGEFVGFAVAVAVLVSEFYKCQKAQRNRILWAFLVSWVLTLL